MIHIVYHSTSSFKFTQSEYSHTVMHSIIVIYIMLLILARQNLPYPTHLKEHLHPLRCSKAGIRLWIVPRNRPSLISCPFCFSLLFLRIRYIGYKLKMKFQIASRNIKESYYWSCMSISYLFLVSYIWNKRHNKWWVVWNKVM